ncbi:cyclic lactone autoinducer peptide [Tissierella carlieri]|uniref:cyclic lactone autoinducer peptide n=1 Tax=Tissierella TaxID=41273 RepID=UPI001C10E6A8|nr:MULTISPECIES: cyclic lactone autoinducer peptide [Tissierella]MBU5314544.1 cyclic lactone autoinducer peptide [Tissierella carlieri]
MRNLRSLGLKFSMTLASLALMVTSLNVNTTCMLIAHQPELPEGAKKLRKF